MKSLARNQGGAPFVGNPACPPDKAEFFTNLGIYQDMAQRLDTNADFIMALSAHESGWLGTHSQQLHNLFGVTHGGGPNLGYESYQAAADYWLMHFGEQVRGARTMDEFIAGLRRAHYNTRDPDYDTHLRDAYATLQRYRRHCGIR